MPFLILFGIILFVIILIYRQKTQDALPMIDLHEHLPAASQKVVYVDVRSRDEFAAGSAPGAVNIPVDEIVNRSDELREANRIILFCRSGTRATQAKAMLERVGFTNIENGGGVENVRQSLGR